MYSQVAIEARDQYGRTIIEGSGVLNFIKLMEVDSSSLRILIFEIQQNIRKFVNYEFLKFDIFL